MKVCSDNWASQMYYPDVIPRGINLSMQETQEMWVRFPGQEDDLDEGMATHSSILPWRISWTEDPGMLQSIGSHSI